MSKNRFSVTVYGWDICVFTPFSNIWKMGKQMRIFLIPIFIFFSLVGIARADFSAAWKAYEIGNYEKYYYEIENDIDEINVLSEIGKANAQYTLGYIHDFGVGALPIDDDEARKWYLLAAGQGHADAKRRIGNQYKTKYEGDLILSEMPSMTVVVNEEDLLVAAKWWVDALRQYRVDAKQGSANAMFRIGELYSYGHGVAEDDREAFMWFRRAAGLGHVHAMFKLALIYEKGIGVLESYVEAENWYRQSSELGYARAQRNLAYKYQHGLGVSVDHVKSYAWYLLSAVDGTTSIQEEKDELAEVMTTDEIVQAQRLATTLLKGK